MLGKIRVDGSESELSMKTFTIYNNGIWRASARKTNGTLRLFLENLKTGFCEWPIMYGDGTVGYDRPERVPRYVKRVVESILGEKRNDQWVRLCDCGDLV